MLTPSNTFRDYNNHNMCLVNITKGVKQLAMEAKDRIAQARNEKKWSQAQLAEACGWGQSRIGNYESGAREPKRDDWIVLADALGVTPSWLQFGVNTTAEEPGAPYAVNPQKYAMIKRYHAAGGMGAGADNGHEEIGESHAYRRDWLEKNKLVAAMLVVIDAAGDSMHPTIFDGDVVLIDTMQRKVANGQVYAFNTEDGVRIKRLFKQLDGRVRIVSDNADKVIYPDEFLTAGMNVEVIGRVVHRSGGV